MNDDVGRIVENAIEIQNKRGSGYCDISTYRKKLSDDVDK